MYTPELSIIVYARCAELLVVETLKSICRQSFQEWECIVVEDGSMDQTASLVKEFVVRDSRFNLIRQSYGGVSKARNRGFLESSPTTAFVSFLDAGDVWVPSALEELISHLRRNEDAVGAHGISDHFEKKVLPLDSSIRESTLRPRLEYQDGRFKELLLVEPTSFATLICDDILSPSGVLVARRVSYEAAGLYDPKLRQDEQWDMGLRLSRIGPIQYVNSVILHSSSSRESCVEKKKCGVSFRGKRREISALCRNSPKHLAILNKGWRALNWIRIKQCWHGIFSNCARGALMGALRGIWNLPRHVFDYVAGHPLAGYFGGGL